MMNFKFKAKVRRKAFVVNDVSHYFGVRYVTRELVQSAEGLSRYAQIGGDEAFREALQK